MKTKILALFAGCCLLAACTGVPLSSLPRLMSLQSQWLEANPAQFAVAIQLDERMAAPLGNANSATPVLQVLVKPLEPGAFAVIDKKLATQLNPWQPGMQGLEPARTGRRWLLYQLTPAAQLEFGKVQAAVRQLQAQKKSASNPNGIAGGSVSITVSQEHLPSKDPQFASTRWESWLQTNASEGFFEMWSGPVSSLLKPTGTR